MMPCLTHTRAASLAYWITTRGQCVDAHELPKFQGMKLADFGNLDSAGVTMNQSAGIIGNCVSLNVIEQVLIEGLWAAGLVASKPVNRWNPN